MTPQRLDDWLRGLGDRVWSGGGSHALQLRGCVHARLEFVSMSIGRERALGHGHEAEEGVSTK